MAESRVIAWIKEIFKDEIESGEMNIIQLGQHDYTYKEWVVLSRIGKQIRESINVIALLEEVKREAPQDYDEVVRKLRNLCVLPI